MNVDAVISLSHGNSLSALNLFDVRDIPDAICCVQDKHITRISAVDDFGREHACFSAVLYNRRE